MEELKLEIEIAKELPELSQQAVLPAKNESITYFKASNQEARFDTNNSYQPVIPLNERRFKKPSDRVLKKVKLDDQLIFEERKLDQEKIKEYLKFAGQFINKQKHKMDDQGFITNINHLNFEENALNFLHKMNYSTTKAKFFLLFPTLLYFNQLKPDNCMFY